MNSKIILEIHKEEKHILMDALTVYKRYLDEEMGRDNMNENRRVIFDNTMARTKDMLEQIENI